MTPEQKDDLIRDRRKARNREMDAARLHAPAYDYPTLSKLVADGYVFAEEPDEMFDGPGGFA